jgi:hypothetical protein
MVQRGIQKQVMVAGDDDVMSMGLRAKPIDTMLKLLKEPDWVRSPA